MMSVHEVDRTPAVHFLQPACHAGLRRCAQDRLEPGHAKLTGTSKVVGGETYKLVIATNGLKPASCSAQGAKAEIKVINNEADGIAVLSIDRTENGTVDWSVSLPRGL